MKYPQSFTNKNNLQYITELPFGYEGFNGSGVTAADISSDGQEILIKNYSKVYYFKKHINQTLEQSLKNDTQTVNYIIEPQGEAITWETQARGYYTLSEVGPFNIPPHLYYYQRSGTSVKKKLKKNPEIKYFDNTLFIEYDEILNNSKLLLYNISGNLILMEDIHKDNIKLENLSKGIYFIKIIPGNIIIKIMKD